MRPASSSRVPQSTVGKRTDDQNAVQYIKDGDSLLAVIISAAYAEQGVHFFTPGEFSQQLAYMRHPAGKVIEPHVHAPVPRQVTFTHEVLVIKRGKLRVDLYDDQQRYLESRILCAGDVILLAMGGHGFEVLEEIEMVEVKQGPYVEEFDKRRFVGITAERARLTR